MASLTEIRRKILTREDFDKYPVWTWDDTTEYSVPVINNPPSLEDGYPLFIKGRFSTNGYQFDGYLIGGDSFYAFGLFINDQEFVFNLSTPDLMEIKLLEVFRILKTKPFKFLPIRYESDVRLKNSDKKICGILDLKQNKKN